VGRLPVRERPLVRLAFARNRWLLSDVVTSTRATLIVNVKGAYRQYCGLPVTTLDRLMTAPSMGQFLKGNIESAGSGGPYGCESWRLTVSDTGLNAAYSPCGGPVAAVGYVFGRFA
jgi:hypothetical protein